MERPSTPPTVLQPVFPLNEHMPRRDFKKEKKLNPLCYTEIHVEQRADYTHIKEAKD